MAFAKEPPYQHGTPARTGILLVNLGTPDAPTAAAVRPYLKQFLSDPRVVEIPPFIWFIILNFFILPFRSRQSAEKYASVWTDEGSPLQVHTQRQGQQLQEYLSRRGHQVKVVVAMRYGLPSIEAGLSELKQAGCDRILILPLYPQYSGTTTASVYDAVFRHYATVRNVPDLRFVKHYHDDPGYIEALRDSVLRHWQQHGRPEKLVMSFHGTPKRTLLLGDPYHCECHKTARLLAMQLGLKDEDYIVTFQSRFGKAEWLQPYTAPTVQELAKKGIRHIDVMCPGFAGDCLETLEEIAMEVRQDFLTAGGRQFGYIPCLNDDPRWLEALADIAEQYLAGWALKADPSDLQAEIARTRALGMGAER